MDVENYNARRFIIEVPTIWDEFLMQRPTRRPARLNGTDRS
jgi:hypothetical protein